MRHRLYEVVKAGARFFVRNWPFGNLWKSSDGRGGTIRVTKSLWVITSDGISQDALPLNLCSQSFVDRVAADLNGRWYMPATPTAPSSDASEGAKG